MKYLLFKILIFLTRMEEFHFTTTELWVVTISVTLLILGYIYIKNKDKISKKRVHYLLF